MEHRHLAGKTVGPAPFEARDMGLFRRKPEVEDLHDEFIGN
jgi:hypothetical protein